MAGPAPKKAKLVGYDNFVRTNPRSDRFEVLGFHHLEFLCGDAKTTAARFCTALGFRPLAHSNMLTGNTTYASHAVSSGSVIFVCTAPYGDGAPKPNEQTTKTLPNAAFDASKARTLFSAHGQHVSAVGIRVVDAKVAYERACAGGAESFARPHTDESTGVTVAEVRAHTPLHDARACDAQRMSGQVDFVRAGRLF